ncbi:hypothetical protein SA3096_00700 [Aggregatibacter actinomycetemcomitans serotype e str. SA3096]|nr:hypothetical protein SA3096_00700 [Aggregatibacter actinomycetemcomitans serotype e str. SA3096]
MRIIDKNSLNKIIMKICLAIMAIKTGKSSILMNFLRKNGNLMGKQAKKCGHKKQRFLNVGFANGPVRGEQTRDRVCE